MYGRDGDLKMLNDDRNNSALSKFVRLQADKAYHKVVSQIKDKKLMRLRLQLINAVKKGDLPSASKIEQQMRSHVGEDRETGIWAI